MKTFTIWFGKDSWHKELKQNLIEHRLYGYYDSGYESAISYRFLDFALGMLGKNNLSKYMTLNLKTRSFFCPECKRSIERDSGILESKWAFLNPNEPSSTTIACLNCHNSFVVSRKNCVVDNCKGNVLFDDQDYAGGLVCLTCFSSQDNE